MQEPTYRDALRTAWEITKTHKFLFIFGLFALFVGQLGVLDLITKIGFMGTSSGSVPLWALLPALGYGGAISFAGMTLQTSVLLAWVGVIILGFICFLSFVSVSSHGALIHATGQFIDHPRKEVSLTAAWHAGITHFWRLFFIVLIKKIILTLLAIGVAITLVNAASYGSTLDTTIFIAFFVLALIVGFYISIVSIYVAGYLVLEQYKLKEAIAAAWELLREHWLVSIEIGLTVVVLNIFVTIVAAALIPILFIPTILLWGVASGIVSAFILIQIGTFFAVGVLFLLIASLGAFLSVYTTALWMSLFQQMHRKGFMCKIIRLISRS